MTYPAYDFHVFICQNQRPDGHARGCCLSKGSDKLLNYMKARVKELGILNTRVNKAGCLDQCEQGVAVVTYPEGIWHQIQSYDDVEALLQRMTAEKLPIETES